MKIYENCFDIIKNYNAFLIDVWGVLHSSGVAYSNAHKALENMMQIGTVILLSNAPRRAKKVEDFLSGIGFKKGVHFHDILTSGEAFVKNIDTNNERFPECSSVFYIGPERDLDVIDRTRITITQNVSDNFTDAILTGLTQDNNNLEPDIEILKQLLQKNITISCLNPDIVVKAGNSHQLCAGAVAKEYEKMGGKVKYFGKPYNEVYGIASQMFNKNANILAIGDGMETDILGANNFSIDSALCVTGIHHNAISYNGIENFLNEFSFKPTFVINSL